MSLPSVTAQVGGLDLRFHPESEALRGALHDLMALLPPAPGGALAAPASDVFLAEGAPATLTFEAGRLRLKLTAETLEAGLRGALGAFLDQRGGALMHAAGVVLGEVAVLCIAPSEGGKTTLSTKVSPRLPVLSDETIALHLDGPAPAIAGTCFWSGDPLPSAVGRFPLAAICFLRKGRDALEPVARVEALQALLAEWHLPERPQATGDAMARAAAVLERVPSFALFSTLDASPLANLAAAAAQLPPARAPLAL